MSTFHTYLFDEVNYNSVKEVTRDIDTANNDSSVSEIVLTICSGGGKLYPSYGLYDQIKSSNKPITIIAQGMCASAAFMLLQAGIKRIARKNTHFMIHSSNYIFKEPKYYDELMNMMEDYKKSHSFFIEATLNRSKLGKQEFEKVYTIRKYMSPEEA